MPNFCENELLIHGHNAADILPYLHGTETDSTGETKELLFDFERIVPTPARLLETESGTTDDVARICFENDGLGKYADAPFVRDKNITTTRQLAAHFHLDYDKMRELGKQLVANFLAYGASNWYHWRLLHWGTKWNACDPRLIRQSKRSVLIAFETAWSPPEPIVIKLAQMFPQLRFTLRYWEAGNGFKGTLSVHGGTVTKNHQTDYRGPRGG